MSFLQALKLTNLIILTVSGVCSADTRVLIPAGEYTLPFGDNEPTKISAFYIDKFPRTVGSSKIVRTQVNWFEAQTDCRNRGGRLPTTDEWEFAARLGEDETKILERYSKPSPHLFKAGLSRANDLGVHDLLGLVWEWTEDFNALNIAAGDDRFFCGGASVKAKDPSQYSIFMRYAYRSSLKPTYQARNLGYRCAYDVDSMKRQKHSSLSPQSLYGLNAHWVKSSGETIATKDLAGKIRLVAMIYTRCKTVCPLVTSYLKKLESDLPANLKDKIRFTLISFDTENDRAEELMQFKRKYNLGDEWDIIAGDKQNTRWLAQQLEVFYKKKFDQTFAHSGVISVINESGKLVSQVMPSNLSRAFIEGLLL